VVKQMIVLGCVDVAVETEQLVALSLIAFPFSDTGCFL
jgi:hypothetical protein